MSTDSARQSTETPDVEQQSTNRPTKDGLPFALTIGIGVGLLFLGVLAVLNAENIMTAIIGEDRIESVKEARRLAKRGIDTIPAVVEIPKVPMADMPVRAGLQSWIRAGDAVKGDRGGVAYIPDLSGNGNHATQVRQKWQPGLKMDAINGQAVLRFDGTDDFMNFGSYSDSTYVTAVCVWLKPKAGGDAFQRLYSSGSQGMDYQAKGVYYIPKTENNGIGASPVQITMKRPRKMKDASNFIIGRLNVKSEPPQHFFGQLAELMLYDRRVSDEERDQIQAYLTAKYGL